MVVSAAMGASSGGDRPRSVPQGQLVDRYVSSVAAAELRAVSGRLEPGMGITTGDRASIHARHTCWDVACNCWAT